MNWMLMQAFQKYLKNTRKSGMGIFTKINEGFNLVFEKVSILYVWLNPESTYFWPMFPFYTP